MNDFQQRVDDWMQKCFGAEISKNIIERNHRFFEEATELVQSTGMSKTECLQLIDYVYGREIGEPEQEVGGVTVTLNALCNALGIYVDDCQETELSRIWTLIKSVREKQAKKPNNNSPLP